jgi:6-phosphogluconolactonase
MVNKVSGRAPEVWIGDDAAALAHEGAKRIADIARRSIAARGRFLMALAGGTTPRRLYRSLAVDEIGIDWSRVEIYFSDERLVPWDSPDSNYAMARDTLLERVPIPKDQIHAVQTELPPDEAANRYEETLRRTLDRAEPRLDLALLGMGPDGHTASIFPGSRLLAGLDDDFLIDDPSTGPLRAERPAVTLATWDRERLVAAVLDAPKPPPQRITMTPYLLNLARHVLVLVAGEDKVAAVSAALESDARVSEIPVRAISPATGELVWLLDRRAARALGSPPI